MRTTVCIYPGWKTNFVQANVRLIVVQFLQVNERGLIDQSYNSNKF